ncbi:type II toxin-antitoxin system VapC family toxin [Mycobacterium sp.]|uniref:type II toxin-antitoxin system VapC family toxin n=1 Tax=Mycobacterium sp. TaxID=1785 RepID=UPI003D0DF6F9
MTAFLLDTNALLALVSTPDKIAAGVRDTLADPANELIVSAASAWEIAIKTRIERLDGMPLLSSWGETLASMRATDLAIDSADAALAGQLSWNQKDPFDRMIVAQATRRGFTIATSDAQITKSALTAVIKVR